MNIKTTLRWAAYGVVALAFYYFFSQLVKRLDEIPPLHWDAGGVGAMVLSVLAVALTIGLNGWMFNTLLRDKGHALPLPKAMQVIAVAQFGKYLPGNVGHFVGRAALAHSAGVPISASVGSMLIETLWNLIIAFGFAAMAAVLFAETLDAAWPYHLGPTELTLIGVALTAVPPLGVAVLNRLLPGLSKRLGGGTPVTAPSLKTSLQVGATIVLDFCLLGGALKLQAVWLFGVPAGDLITLTALFTASWLVGYLVPGAPGGMGVREAVMVVLFTPVVGAGAAVGLGVSMRVATMLGDSLAFALGLLSRRWV